MTLRLLAAAALGAGLLACSASPPPSLPEARPTATGPARSSTSDLPPADSPQTRAVLRDYLRYWEGVRAAHATRSPDAPLLLQYAAGAARSRIAAAVRTNIDRGYYRRGTVTHRPAVVTLADTTATVRDCADISGWTIYSVRTGRPVPIGPADPSRVTVYDLTRRGQTWVVERAVDGPAC